ncbi:MAG TPA: cytochrome c biogenesis protein CcdA [Balneolaceae bacterium]|nr:cytochrome c biogenesis protein CcdA [Balneolaceae bacterium]
MNISAKIWMGILMVMVSPFLVYGQKMADPVSFSISHAPDKVKAGAVFKVRVRANIDNNWHLYAADNNPNAGPQPTQFSVASDSIKMAGSLKESKPIKKYDKNFKSELRFYKNKATFTVPVAFKKDVNGKVNLKLQVLYQVCNNKICLPPRKKTISKTIIVAGTKQGKAAVASHKQGVSGGGLNGKTEQAAVSPAGSNNIANKGFLSFIWLAIVAGFGALVTPCVYPMIPLTVSFFSKKNQGSKHHALSTALGFGGTIIGVFTIIGILLTLVVGASGADQFASSPWVNLFIAIVLIIFAISLLGAFNIRLPYQLTNWLNQKSNEKTGFIGVLFIALTISAVSFSCTVPFVGGLLSAASRGAWFYPIIGMVCFSAAFSSPFVLFAFFPSLVKSLPESGGWMNIIKVLLGFIELAAAFKFISNAALVWQWGFISRTFVIAAWIAIFLLAGFYLLGIFTIKPENIPSAVGAGRVLLALPFLFFSFYLIPGLLGSSLGTVDAWLPPKKVSDVGVSATVRPNHKSDDGAALKKTSKWSRNYQASLKQAAKSKEPIFVDFTGYTCTNCRAMEANVFPVASVQRLFRKMKLVRLYTDGGKHGSRNQKIQFRLTGTVALPTYVIVNPNTKKVLVKLEGYTKKQQFQKFLTKGLNRFQAQKSDI